MVARILIIEDDVDLGAELQDGLTRRGFDCRASATLAEASRTLIDHKPDIVVSDVCLPDGDGIRFLEQHRAAMPLTRWLLTTGNSDVGFYERGRGVTVVDKPLAWHTLIDFIRDARADWSR